MLLHIEGMGWGARADSDGNDAIITKNGNCLNSPCEVFEVRYPVRIESYRIAENSPGAGRHRGGCGVERIWRCLAPITVSAHLTGSWYSRGESRAAGPPTIRLCCSSERRRVNGRPPTSCSATLSSGKFSNIQLMPGDQILLRTPGGGGYGDPLDRDPGNVRRDVLDGLIDAAGAADVYGVVMDADRESVDAEATAV